MTIYSLDVLLFLFGTSLLFHVLLKLGGFPGGSVVKNPPANAGDTEMSVSSLGQDDPLEEEMATHSSILSWRIP